MLTPVSALHVSPAAIKAHGSETRTASGRQLIEEHADSHDPHAAPQSPTIGISGNTALSSVNAVTATAANRTVLQLLAFAIAAQLHVTRQPNENLEAFFLRLAATIDAMSDGDRTAVEVRSGLKALNIRLTDLAAALKAPEGGMAARLVAMAEQPRTPFARAAAALATSSYLQEGSGTPRSSEAFSIEATVRSSDERLAQAANDSAPATDSSPEGDARSLQIQLKTMFEAGASAEARAGSDPSAATPEQPAGNIATGAAADTDLDTERSPVVSEEGFALQAVPSGPELAVETASTEAESATAGSQGASMAMAETNLATDLAAGPITEGADAAQLAFETGVQGEALRQEGVPAATNDRLRENRLTEKNQLADRRLETLLILKGFSEVIAVKPELPAHIVSQPDPADPRLRPAAGDEAASVVVAEALARIEKAVASATAAIHRHTAGLTPAIDAEDPATARARQNAAAEQASGNSGKAGDGDVQLPAKAAAAHEFVPFAYAPLPPARQDFHAKDTEDEPRREDGEDENDGDDQSETGDERRERLAKKAQDDLLDAAPEQLQTIAINRDSSESDRAYAQYQRMGGF